MIGGAAEKVTTWFESWPDTLLSVALLTVAVFLVLAAFRAGPIFKAVTLAWVIAP